MKNAEIVETPFGNIIKIYHPLLSKEVKND